jgi:invasion protein IalB
VAQAWLPHLRSSAGILLLCPTLALFGLLPSHGMSQGNLEVRRFGNWEVVCEPSLKDDALQVSPATRGAKTCKTVQRLVVKGADETVFAVSVLPSEKTGSVAIVSVPLGGYLVPGIEFSVDGKKPYKLLIETCTAAGCHAGFPLTGQVSKDMRAGKSASFRVWSSKSHSSDVKVSLNGFADAMSYLERRP